MAHILLFKKPKTHCECWNKPSRLDHPNFSSLMTASSAGKRLGVTPIVSPCTLRKRWRYAWGGGEFVEV